MKEKTFLSISQKNTSHAYILWIQRNYLLLQHKILKGKER